MLACHGGAEGEGLAIRLKIARSGKRYGKPDCVNSAAVIVSAPSLLCFNVGVMLAG